MAEFWTSRHTRTYVTGKTQPAESATRFRHCDRRRGFVGFGFEFWIASQTSSHQRSRRSLWRSLHRLSWRAFSVELFLLPCVLCFHIFAVRLHQLLLSARSSHGAFLFFLGFGCRFVSFAGRLRYFMRDRVPINPPEPSPNDAVSPRSRAASPGSARLSLTR